MALAAFTNAPGGHSQRLFAENRQTGQWWFDNGHPGPPMDIRESHEYNSETCFKSPLVRSDHFLPTTFERRVRKVTLNKPLIVEKRTYYNNGQLGSYHNVVTHLSTTIDPLGFAQLPGVDEKLAECLGAAITRARNKLRDGKLQNGADIAEAGKTASMIAGDFLTLLRAFRGNRDLASLRDLTGGSLADFWLKWIYGYKPLLGSVHDNIKQLDKVLNRPKTVHFKVKGGMDASLSDEDNSTDHVFSRKWKGGARCQLWANLSDEFLAGLDTTGVLNPLEVLWELAPYSFAVDWFTGVGDYLSSLSATAGLVLIAGFTSSREEWSGTITFNRKSDDYITLQPGVLQTSGFAFSRTNTPLWPVGGLTPKDNPFSSTHMVTALALYRQLFR